VDDAKLSRFIMRHMSRAGLTEEDKAKLIVALLNRLRTAKGGDCRGCGHCHGAVGSSLVDPTLDHR
jgi:hypothetical protein